MPRKQKVQVAPSQQYGQAAQQEAALKAIPLPDNTPSFTSSAQSSPPIPTSAPAAQPMAEPPSPVTPGMGGAFDAPSDRPFEHVSAGLPIGQGPGPEALRSQQDDDLLVRLRAMYSVHPNQDIADMIDVILENRDA